MLAKMNENCLNSCGLCPNASQHDIYICQLAWNDEFVFVSDLSKFIELEHKQWDLLNRNERLSVEAIDNYLGLDIVPACDRHLYFSPDNMLEFEVLPAEHNGEGIYKIYFTSQPVYSSSNKTEEKYEKTEFNSLFSPNRTLKKDIHKELLDLKYWVRDFADIGNTDGETLLDRLNKIINMVCELEVK